MKMQQHCHTKGYGKVKTTEWCKNTGYSISDIKKTTAIKVCCFCSFHFMFKINNLNKGLLLVINNYYYYYPSV